LFYFVPKIQGYSGGTSADGLFGQSGSHYAPVGSPGNYPGNPDAGYTTGDGSYNPIYNKDLYDLFYEGNEAGLNPPGLFDYSKGQWTAVTATTKTVAWTNAGVLVPTGYSLNNYRKVIIIMSGFSNAGAGQLIGPNGNTMDTEEFLSGLNILGVGGASGNVYTSANTTNPYLFRVVTQRYGKGIVQYGNQVNTTWPTGNNSGGSYYNVCDANGFIYLEVDLQAPVCITCGDSSMDG
jgi:hypothetical protein